MKKVGKSSKKGFTLVELIVVLVILAILAAMLVPALVGYIDRAKKEKEFQAASTIYAAAQALATEAYGKGDPAPDFSDLKGIKDLTGVKPDSVVVSMVTKNGTDIGGFTINQIKVTFGSNNYYYTRTAATWNTGDKDNYPAPANNVTGKT